MPVSISKNLGQPCFVQDPHNGLSLNVIPFHPQSGNAHSKKPILMKIEMYPLRADSSSFASLPKPSTRSSEWPIRSAAISSDFNSEALNATFELEPKSLRRSFDAPPRPRHCWRVLKWILPSQGGFCTTLAYTQGHWHDFLVCGF